MHQPRRTPRRATETAFRTPGRAAAALVVLLGSSIAAFAQTTPPPSDPPPADAEPAAQERPAAATDQQAAADLRVKVFAVEEARDSTPAGLGAIETALKSKDTETRRVAVRALGRLGQASLAPMVAQQLTDPGPVVRAEAANALAQAASLDGGDVALASDLMLGLLERETHPLVRGALALSLGRLPYRDVAAIRRAEQAILATARGRNPGEEPRGRPARDVPSERTQLAPPLTLLGALRGIDALARRHARTAPLEAATIDGLRQAAVAWRSAVARAEGGPTVEAGARLRRLAMSALLSAGAADPTTISTAFGDGDDQVRAFAARAAAVTEPLDTKLVERAVRDAVPMVRSEIVVSLARRGHAAACGYAAVLLRDPDYRTRLAAIDAAALACSGNAGVIAALASAANRPPPPPLVDVGSPGTTSDARSTYGLVTRGMRQPTWQPAAHALLALARLSPDQARERLGAFATDARPGVKVYAARAAAILRAAEPLRTLAADADPAVRDLAAAALAGIEGRTDDTRPGEPAPAPNPPATAGAQRAASGVPSASQLEGLGSARLVARVRDVGRFEIRLLPQEAPLSAWRFYQRARNRDLDALTVGGLVSNILVNISRSSSTSSTTAAPQAPDEPSLQSNIRGTLSHARVDAQGTARQLQINLLDNSDRDHVMTVFAQIDRGIEVIDALLEGDVIEIVEEGKR